MYDSQKCVACLKPLWHCRCLKRCEECGCLTNHTTEQHRKAEKEEGDDELSRLSSYYVPEEGLS
jgi:hypothetical protein